MTSALTPCVDEVVEALEGVLAHLADRLGAVGLAGGVADVEDRLVRQLVDHGAGDREAAEAGVEDADGGIAEVGGGQSRTDARLGLGSDAAHASRDPGHGRRRVTPGTVPACRSRASVTVSVRRARAGPARRRSAASQTRRARPPDPGTGDGSSAADEHDAGAGDLGRRAQHRRDPRLGAAGAPTFHRLLDEGAGTLNARTEYEQTVTLPNHTGMMTGRRIDRGQAATA